MKKVKDQRNLEFRKQNDHNIFFFFINWLIFTTYN